MIIPINLERLSGDGYKMCANNPLAENLSNITHAQLRYTPFTSSQSVQGTFVTGSNSTVEFNLVGTNITRFMKLYVSTNGSTYGEVKSWGGTNGIRVINPDIEVVGDYTITSTTGDINLNANGQIVTNVQIVSPSINTPQLAYDGAMTIQATDGAMYFTSATLIYNFSDVPTYADNASAILGGLTVGTMYRTSTGVLMIVYTP